MLQTTGEGSIVVLGNSITDGYHTSLRWTDVLQARIDMLSPSEQRAVVNEGITAKTLTAVVRTDDLTGGGPAGASRLARDALTQAGVSEVVRFLGSNDLWCGSTADQVIAGYEQAIIAAHGEVVRIVAVPLLPRNTSREERWTTLQQQYLQHVDQWILTSGAFDAVLNLGASVANVYDGACTPTAIFPKYDSGDQLHPDARGQTAMADAVDGAALDLPPLPGVPPLMTVAPTPGCQESVASWRESCSGFSSWGGSACGWRRPGGRQQIVGTSAWAQGWPAEGDSRLLHSDLQGGRQIHDRDW